MKISSPFLLLWRKIVFLALLLLWMFVGKPGITPSFASEGIQLDWEFENGSLQGWSTNAKGEIILRHSPNSGGIWYFFQINGVKGKTLTFVFEEARKDFYGHINLPALSYDQKSWTFIKKCQIQPHASRLDRVRYQFTHTFAMDSAWIAYSPPYTNERLDVFLREIGDHPHVTIQSLGDSPLQRHSLPVVLITDPSVSNEKKKNILFLCREEAYGAASSWVGQGIIRYLLSDDPVAKAIKKKVVFLLLPLFDRDGVGLGSTAHPVTLDGLNIYWPAAWPETAYSFFEQRQLKWFLQQWKDQGKLIDFSFRLHSKNWSNDHFYREHTSKENQPSQDLLFAKFFSQKYLPWYQNRDKLIRDTRFSKFVFDLFPQAITGLCQSDHRYVPAFNPERMLFKSVDDLQTEGELLVRALADFLSIPASDPPPFLHAAEFYELTGDSPRMFHVRCVYRDLLNRPPSYVRVQLNDQVVDLTQVRESEDPVDYQAGVLYSGFIPIEKEFNTHLFLASNGSQETHIPRTGSRIGPLLVLKKKKK